MSNKTHEATRWTIEVTGVELRRDPLTDEYVCEYVGFGSDRAELRTKNPVHLGFCYRPERRFGIIWDIAYGYVSGFPIKALLWYTLTRSLPNESTQRRIRAWEVRSGRHDPRVFDSVLGGRVNLRNLGRLANV